MKAVSLVKIRRLLPIFKDGEPANAIEVAHIQTMENDPIEYDIIVGKGLYEVGNKAIYIQPDYTIPQTPLFVEYHAPQGDPRKCKLGKKGRIRAIKFNFNFEGKPKPIYSNGILIPYPEAVEYIEKGVKYIDDEEEVDGNTAYYGDNEIEIPRLKLGYGEHGPMVFGVNFEDPEFPYQEVLGIEKYVADDSLDGNQPSGMTKGLFPSFMYKTDEETIQNHRKAVDTCYENKEVLSFTQKRDGSSITEYFRINPVDETEEFGICSRKQEKKLEQTFVEGYQDGDAILHKYLHPETKTNGWYNPETKTFYTDEEAKAQFEPVKREVRDAWVDTDRHFGYLKDFTNYCREHKLQMCIRGELIGAGNKGSGNKLNPDARLKAHVVWFGVDDLSKGFAERIHYGQDHNLIQVCEELGFEYTKEICSGAYSYDEIIEEAHKYFANMKEEYGIIVEGVVIRTKYSNNLSVKYINPEYDSKS